MLNKKTLSFMLSTTLCVAMLPLAGCDKKAPDQPAATDASAPAKPAYVPPTAEQLYQMVGPIALFPDKLVAQVLAGSTYPDQITAADNWLAQNKNLKAAQLQTAANQQPWDVSVKGLTTFPNVLDQMAQNIQWTSALGEAYVNDPTDVMNAIQVMRQRASTSGNLKTTKQQKIAVRPRVNQTPPPDGYVLQPGEPPVYSGPEVIPAPPEMIVIEPAEPDYVYVPTYDPRVVYGEPLPVYPNYRYQPPPVYSTGEVVTTGAISFGLGVAVGAVISNSNWGWNSWGVHWGGDRGRGQDNGGDRGDRGRGGPDGGGWHRPAVVYNNSTYVSRSTTVVNRVTNTYNNNSNNNNSINTRNNTNNNFAPARNNGAPANAAPAPAAVPGGGVNGNNVARPNFAPQNPQNPQRATVPPGARSEGAGATQPNFGNMARPQPGQNSAGGIRPPVSAPNFNNMTKPDFNHGAPGGNNQQRPTANPMTPAESGKPHQNQEQRFENNPQNRPAAGGQMRPEMTRPSQTPAAAGPSHPEARPQVQQQERPQQQPHPQVQQQERPQQQPHPQVQQQERPQQQPQPQVQQQERLQQPPHPQVQQQERPQQQPHPQAPSNHAEPHEGDHPHPAKKDESKHE